MTYQEVLENARGQMGPCKACPVCDGRACRNTIPGPGAKGTGDTAMRNYSAWQNIRVNMDTLCRRGRTGHRLHAAGAAVPPACLCRAGWRRTAALWQQV